MLFGLFTVTGGVLTDVCVAIDEVLAGLPSRLPETDCTDIAMAALEADQSIKRGITEAIANANSDIMGAPHTGVPRGSVATWDASSDVNICCGGNGRGQLCRCQLKE